LKVKSARRPKLLGVLKGLRPEEVVNQMSFTPEIGSPVVEIEPPTEEELHLLREKIDPDRAIIGR